MKIVGDSISYIQFGALMNFQRDVEDFEEGEHSSDHDDEGRSMKDQLDTPTQLS
jgi:hypothetical protein